MLFRSDIPGVPFLGKWPEGADAIVVGEVEEDVAEAGQAGVEEEESPARREIGIFYFAAAKTPDEIDEADYRCGVEWNSKEGVREAAMMREAKGRAADAAQDIEIRGFGGERERERGKGGLTIESGASHTRAGQEVGDRFQAVKRILWGCAEKCQG